jgi:hypothetical protein
MSTKIEELEARLAAKRAERAQLEAMQYEADLEALLALEDEHGVIAAVKVARFVPGHPTRVFVRTPKSSEYQRFKDLIHRAVERKSLGKQAEAGEQLARMCWVYPGTEEARAAMLDAFPGLLANIQLAATALAEGKAEDEGKG